ncbi:hypothetical protein D3C78_1062000 [compost metagenome]
MLADELAVRAVRRHDAQAAVEVVVAPQAQQRRVLLGAAGMRRMDDRQVDIAGLHRLFALVVRHHQPVDLVDVDAVLAQVGLGDELGAGAEAVEADGLALEVLGRADAGVLAHEVLHVRRLFQGLAAGGHHLEVQAAGDRGNHQRHHAHAEVDLAGADQRNQLRRGDLADIFRPRQGSFEITQFLGQIDQVERGVVRVFEFHHLVADAFHHRRSGGVLGTFLFPASGQDKTGGAGAAKHGEGSEGGSASDINAHFWVSLARLAEVSPNRIPSS